MTLQLSVMELALLEKWHFTMQSRVSEYCEMPQSWGKRSGGFSSHKVLASRIHRDILVGNFFFGAEL